MSPTCFAYAGQTCELRVLLNVHVHPDPMAVHVTDGVSWLVVGLLLLAVVLVCTGVSLIAASGVGRARHHSRRQRRDASGKFARRDEPDG